MVYPFPDPSELPPRPWLERALLRCVAYVRALSLQRGLAEVREQVAALSPSERAELLELTMKEIGAAQQAPEPHRHASPEAAAYQPWGEGCRVALRRMRSGNPILSLRGIALWLAVAYHESRVAAYPEFERLHRAVLRELRLLKESLAEAPLDDLKRYGLEIRV